MTICGPIMNLALAILFGIPLRLMVASGNYPGGELTLDFVSSFVIINLGLMFFNLLPITPLDGSKILSGLLPVVIDSLGVYGGVYTNTPSGKLADDRLLPNIQDVSTDTAGNTYVAFGYMFSSIRAYDKSKKLLWNLEALLTQQVSDFDA